MNGTRRGAIVMAMRIVLLVAASFAVGAEEAFQPLFNGNDLAGWVNVNTHEPRNGICL